MPSEMNHRCLSLLARLRLFFLLGMAASALLVLLLVTLLGDVYARALLAQKAELFAELLAEHLRLDAQGRAIGFDPRVIEPWILTSLADEMQVRIVDEAGSVLYTNGEARPLGSASASGLPAQASVAIEHAGVAMHLATRIIDVQGRRLAVQAAASERFVGFLRKSFGAPGMRRGVLAMSAAFLLVFLVSFQWLLRRSLRPLHAASAAAQRITPSALAERLDAAAQPAEIRPLVEAFNQALDRLQQGFEAQQRFLASAAHELKTPLALIRAQVELGRRDEARGPLLADIDRMARQVQQLLLLAETSEPLNYQVATIDPRPILEEVCDVMNRVAGRRAVQVELHAEQGLHTWQADRGALFTLAKNLLENAIQHSRQGSAVQLLAGQGGFRVTDQGTGIAAPDLPRIFDRFWRGADRRDEGAGLGLSICAAIAEAHGWRIVPRPLAVGLCMDVRMQPDDPAAAAGALTASGGRGHR